MEMGGHRAMNWKCDRIADYPAVPGLGMRRIGLGKALIEVRK